MTLPGPSLSPYDPWGFSDTQFGTRMRGEGPRWHAVLQLFRLQCRRLGLEHDARFGAGEAQRPSERQLDLFAP